MERVLIHLTLTFPLSHQERGESRFGIKAFLERFC